MASNSSKPKITLQTKLTLIIYLLFAVLCAGDESCKDSPEGWKDAAGWTCRFYSAMNWCTPLGKVGAGWDVHKGSLSDSAVDGVDALQACCECGGGIGKAVVVDPLEQEKEKLDKLFEKTLGSDAQNSATCRDKIEGWKDTGGFTCGDYLKYEFCTSEKGYGTGWQSHWGSFDRYTIDGVDATQICCTCGSNKVKKEDPFTVNVQELQHNLNILKNEMELELSDKPVDLTIGNTPVEVVYLGEEEDPRKGDIASKNQKESIADTVSEKASDIPSSPTPEVTTGKKLPAGAILGKTETDGLASSVGASADEKSPVLNAPHMSSGDENTVFTYSINSQHLKLAYGAFISNEHEKNTIVLAGGPSNIGAAYIPQGLASFLGLAEYSFRLAFTLDISPMDFSSCNGYGFTFMHQTQVECVLQSHDPTQCNGLNLGLITDDSYAGAFASFGDDNIVAYSQGSERFLGKTTKVRVDFLKTDAHAGLNVSFWLDGTNIFGTSYFYPYIGDAELIFGGLTGHKCSNRFVISDISISTTKELDRLEDSLIRQYLGLSEEAEISRFMNTLEKVEGTQLLAMLTSLNSPMAARYAQRDKVIFASACFVGFFGAVAVLKLVLFPHNRSGFIEI